MSERDELVSIVGDGHFKPPTHATSGPCCMRPEAIEQVADAILAAGYRKPRVITTAEELDALPFGSVVIRGGTQGKAWQKLDWHDSNGQLTTNWCTYGNKLRDSETLIRRGSFTVLWEPK